VKNLSRSSAVVAAVALFLGVLMGLFARSLVGTVSAQATAPRYTYFHFTAGECGERGPIGQGVIDLRNGNSWCVPWKGGAPIYQGTLNLGAVPERASSTR